MAEELFGEGVVCANEPEEGSECVAQVMRSRAREPGARDGWVEDLGAPTISVEGLVGVDA